MRCHARTALDHRLHKRLQVRRGGRIVCDPDGTNCRYVIASVSCRVDLPAPLPIPAPAPPVAQSATADSDEADGATVAAEYGENDVNGDGWLTCSGTYWFDTGTWVGACN